MKNNKIIKTLEINAKLQLLVDITEEIKKDIDATYSNQDLINVASVLGFCYSTVIKECDRTRKYKKSILAFLDAKRGKND